MKPSGSANPTEVEAIERLIAQQRFGEAVDRGEALLARQPKLVAAFGCVVRALIPTGRLARAAETADRGLRLSPNDPQLNLLKGIVEHRLGQSDRAITRFRALLERKPANEVEVSFALAEAMHRAGRKDELDAFIDRGGRWLEDERAAVFAGRALLRRDRGKAMAHMEATARATRSALLKRIAGFEAVRLLDAEGKFREAFDLASYIHRETTPAYDLGGLELDVREQAELLGRGKAWFQPRNADRAEDLARLVFVVGMPRSGTTLLEQMLDRHPAISGIGEYEGIFAIQESLVGLGLWPRDLRSLQPADAARLAGEYIAGAHARRRAGATHTFDKTLHAWRMLPAAASVLPGASFVRITRDPRDTAISMFLSNFHPRSWGFTASLESIRRVIALERQIVPKAFEVLGLRAVSVVYEDLVDAPEREIRRVLDGIGVPYDPVVLAPEANTRTVLTLSYEQVRKSINRSSIGRWKNYAFAFGSEWGALA